MENEAAFDSNPTIYDNFAELPTSEERTAMKETVAADDGTGGSTDANDREYGGQTRNVDDGAGNLTGVTENIAYDPGGVMQKGTDVAVHISIVTDPKTKYTYHSHTSGTNTGGTAQVPSVQDYQISERRVPGSQTFVPIKSFVVGKGDNTVYMYSTNGVIATMDMSGF